MTLFSFFFVPQGETKLKVTLDRTAPMIIRVELRVLLSHLMHLFCLIIRMRVSAILLDFGLVTLLCYFLSWCFHLLSR